MESKQLHMRVRDAMSHYDQWLTLDDIMQIVGCKSKSYLKVTLFAMPDIDCRRVYVLNSSAPPKTWRWEFRLIEDEI